MTIDAKPDGYYSRCGHPYWYGGPIHRCEELDRFFHEQRESYRSAYRSRRLPFVYTVALALVVWALLVAVPLWVLQ